MTASDAEPITVCRVRVQFFAVLGVSPVRRRSFTNGDNLPGRPLTVVITQAFPNRDAVGCPDRIIADGGGIRCWCWPIKVHVACLRAV